LAQTKKINFNENRFKPSLIIRDMSYDFAMQNLDVLKNFGKSELIEFKSKQFISKGSFVKVIVESTEVMNELLEKKRIKIGFVSYRINKYFKSPTQCFNCNKFGHIASNCQSSTVCSKCSGDHRHDSCTGTHLKCVNCGKNHSAFDRICESYKVAKRKVMLKSKIVNSNQENNSTRTYSNMIDQGELRNRFDSLDNHFKNLESMIRGSNEKMTEFKENIEHEISRLTVSNNKRLANFMVESVKIMSANKFAVDKNVEKKLVECFENQCLAVEMPLYADYDSTTIQKGTQYYDLSLANKRNVFIAAKPRCL
jgi:hypothetical protein